MRELIDMKKAFLCSDLAAFNFEQIITMIYIFWKALFLTLTKYSGIKAMALVNNKDFKNGIFSYSRLLILIILINAILYKKWLL